MPIQRLGPKDFTDLRNPGVLSQQLLWPKNSPAARVTITRVTMEPGATTPRHKHDTAEQVWFIERGEATLLLADDKTEIARAGQLIRTPAGEVHGLTNSGTEPFVYITATTPPIDLTTSYRPDAIQRT